MVAIPNAGDHVIGSYIKSKDVESVKAECVKFGEGVLGLLPITKNYAVIR